MEANMAYQRLKQIFPHHLENINIYQISPSDIESLIPKNLPHLPLERIHRLCRSQEKNVMNKVLQIKQMDLYDQMASVCPNKDLKIMRTFSHQQVNQKIHHYSCQLAIQKGENSSTSQGQIQIYYDIDSNSNMQEERGRLGNLFDQQCNHFSWNEINIYQMH